MADDSVVAFHIHRTPVWIFCCGWLWSSLIGPLVLSFQDIALMNEQEREGFIRKIGISAGDSDESEDDEEENDPEHHKYNCKKCQVSSVRTASQISTRTSWLGIMSPCQMFRFTARRASTERFVNVQIIWRPNFCVSSCHLQRAESTWSTSWSSTRSEATAVGSVIAALRWKPPTMPTWSSTESSCLTQQCRSKSTGSSFQSLFPPSFSVKVPWGFYWNLVQQEWDYEQGQLRCFILH